MESVLALLSNSEMSSPGKGSFGKGIPGIRKRFVLLPAPPSEDDRGLAFFEEGGGMGKLFGSISFQRSRLIVVILRMPRTLFLRWLALCSLSSCILSPISVPSSEKLSDAPRDCDAKG